MPGEVKGERSSYLTVILSEPKDRSEGEPILRTFGPQDDAAPSAR